MVESHTRDLARIVRGVVERISIRILGRNEFRPVYQGGCQVVPELVLKSSLIYGETPRSSAPCDASSRRASIPLASAVLSPDSSSTTGHVSESHSRHRDPAEPDET